MAYSIRTFVYCLILQRTCRNMRNKRILREEEDAIAMEAPYTSTRSSRIEQSCVLPPDPDLVSAFPSNDASYGTAASGTGEASRSRATEQYQVPVARMVPTANSFSPTVAPQLNAAVLGLGSGDSVADAEGGFQLNEASPQMQSVASDPSLAEVSDIPPGHEEAINPRHGAQKRKISVHEEATSTEFLPSRSGGTTKRALRLRRTTFSAGPSRLPSPRASSEEMEMILDQTTSDITDPRYDVVSDSERDDNDVIAVTNGRLQEVPITPATGPTSEDRDYEIDSVQGSPRQSPAAEAQPSPPQDAEGEGEVEEEETPSLIVKLKLINPYEIAQRRLRRHRLALQLPQAFAMPTQHPEALENTVKLITEIRALDCKRFNQVFGERYATRQLILDQWLDFIDIYLRFRREADFHDDLSIWDAHLDSLEPKKRFAKAGCLSEACVSLMEWRLENPTFSMLECSRDVTWVLVQMAEWKRTLKTADVEEIKMRVVEFHRSLLALFS